MFRCACGIAGLSVLVLLIPALLGQAPKKVPSPVEKKVEKIFRAYLAASVAKDEKALLNMIRELQNSPGGV